MKQLINNVFKNKNILIISPEPWSKAFVSKHHYAVELAKKDNKVYFLNPPSSKLKSKFEISCDDVNGNIRVINYIPIRGLRFLPVLLSTFIERQFIRNLQKACNTKFDIIWNFESSRFYNFNIWNSKVLKILHIVDLNQDFQTKLAASSADICFCTTDFIKERLVRFNKLTFKIHHGASGLYTNNLLRDEFYLSGKNKLKAGYIGNLNIKYLDYNIVRRIVVENSDVDFYFIGQLNESILSVETQKQLCEIKKHSNVFFLGVFPSNTIPAILKTLDILLVLYKAYEYREQLASPHKIMEYLQSGKVILSSYTDEYKDKQDLLVMSNNNEELVSLFNSIKCNIEYYNSDENLLRRKSFAENNTYVLQLKRIANLILENVK